MAEKEPFARFSTKPPVVQLVIAFLVLVLAGTSIFYILIFAGSFIFSLSMSEMLNAVNTGEVSGRLALLRYIQVSQQTGLFLIPSLVIVRMIRTRGISFLMAGKIPVFSDCFLVCVLALLIIPVTTYTGFLNSKMDLPSWLSGIEGWMEENEEQASGIMELLITSPSLGMLVLNVFILAVIPAFSEEILFRGIIQQLLCRSTRSAHAGIFITAVIFSSIHFQFYGFIPRMILGLSFGYLYYWTRNLWMPVLAHFINNSFLVILSWYRDQHIPLDDMAGEAARNPGIPVIPALLSVLILYYFWRRRSDNRTVHSAL